MNAQAARSAAAPDTATPGHPDRADRPAAPGAAVTLLTVGWPPRSR
ncbi:hypothetical protein OG900_36000 [Streptomyces sp. NBC_00433]